MWVNKDFQYSYYQKFCMSFLKNGLIPKHVAFIMDGNRRYAGDHELEKCQGHVEGFSKLSEVLRWCKDFGIREVSVYAFSILNFKRSTEEIDFLMNLANEKFTELLQKTEKLNEQNICVRVLGNLKLLPLNVRQKAARIMELTRFNTQSTLNICMAYGSQDEITRAVQCADQGIKAGRIYASDITSDLLDGCMHFRDSLPLDLVIRTSGELRLSDFMTWQAARYASIYCFVSHYWPEFSVWDLMSAVLHFQVAHYTKRNLCPKTDFAINRGVDATGNETEILRLERTVTFLRHVDNEYWRDIAKMATGVSVNQLTPTAAPVTTALTLASVV